MKAWGKENNNTLAAGFSPLPSLCPSPPHLKFGRDRPPAPTFGPWLGICWDDFDTSSGWLYLETYQDEVGIVFGMLQDIRVCFRTSFDPQSKMKLESMKRSSFRKLLQLPEGTCSMVKTPWFFGQPSHHELPQEIPPLMMQASLLWQRQWMLMQQELGICFRNLWRATTAKTPMGIGYQEQWAFHLH